MTLIYTAANAKTAESTCAEMVRVLREKFANAGMRRVKLDASLSIDGRRALLVSNGKVMATVRRAKAHDLTGFHGWFVQFQ